MIEGNTSQSTFPIVGIGASAGGLDAFKRFLADLPQESHVEQFVFDRDMAIKTHK